MQNGTPSEKTTTNEKSGVKGNLTFDDKVIQKIIGIALSEVLTSFSQMLLKN